MKNVLITGITSFVAQDIINKLSAEYEIFGIGRRDDYSDDRVIYIQTDISDRDRLFSNVQANVNKIETVIHVAAYLGYDEKMAYKINCLGTQNIMDLAKMLGAKTVVLISSIPVIGKIECLPINESHSNMPSNVYHRTKYLSEVICETSLNQKGIRHVILRIASPVGKGLPDGKIFSEFVKNAKNNKDIEVYGSGYRVQNYIDTRDVADAVYKAINCDNAKGMYLLNGNSISDRELAKTVKGRFGSNGNIVIKGNSLESNEDKWIIDDSKAKNDFSYQSMHNILESIDYVGEGM